MENGETGQLGVAFERNIKNYKIIPFPGNPKQLKITTTNNRGVQIDKGGQLTKSWTGKTAQ